VNENSNAGFFLWADFSPFLASPPDSKDPYQSERQLSKKFLDARVYLASGEDFQSDEPGWFRIIFAQEQKKLVEGLERYTFSSQL
jgi:1-aminocyclopropane-1-carboxylate synthase